ncbi:hypothetical protein MIND_01338000 [Mycena indigotica]|uniref:DUF6533 domain-containing protein n=1 Tax=Mycena indigotica TaxID=2126181 RepID=A0A8H6S0U0_9AGAR|nr:uncharacterized protein MIND_01338000 [Mycena indigotica]KAF7290243.1 hypothetical protein MIND_01338000 [Mycena indigotica]
MKKHIAPAACADGPFSSSSHHLALLYVFGGVMDTILGSMGAAEVQRQIHIYYYINAAAFTLLFYDYLITLEWEVARYWGAGRTSPTLLFFANRYGTLLGNIPVVLLNVWVAPPTDAKTRIIVGIMLILRTYALYERSRYVLGFMVAASAGIIAVGVWGTLHSSALPESDKGTAIPLPLGCTYGIKKRESTGLMIAWSAMGLFDVMIFVLTLARTLTGGRRRIPLRGMHLISVLMRDGCLYFGVMVLCNVGNILTFALGQDLTRGILNTLTNIVSSIMISRLMLNLRDPAVHLAPASSRTRIGKRTHGPGYPPGPGVSAEWGAGVFSTYVDPDDDAPREYEFTWAPASASDPSAQTSLDERWA